MIWPEFEDENADVFLYNDTPVPNSETTKMWITNNKMRPFHYDKIKVRVKGISEKEQHFQQVVK